MASNLKCNVECDECAYYQQTFLQRIGFIHQFNHPAAVYKGVNVWGVNEQFADLCGREEKEFIRLRQNTLRLAAGMNGEVNHGEACKSEAGLLWRNSA